MLTRKTGRLIPATLIAVAIMGSLIEPQRFWTVAAQDDAYEEAMQTGKNLFRRGEYEDALKYFKRANEMRGKKSAECFGWMSETYLVLQAYKNVVEAAEKTIEFAAGDTTLIVKAYNNKGLALQASAEKKDQKKLQAAEAVFRQGLAMEGATPILRYNLGVVLLQLKRDEEGIAEMKRYIELAPRGAYVAMARLMAENPRRARENYAPDFSFTSSEGEHIALEDLRGKVVLLDFWGTWCPPCVESVPELRNLHKRYSKEPSFMLIGISSDSDEEKWREFTAKNKMIWPQYRDRDRRIQRAFGVDSFPTYVLIDHEGIVRLQSVGMTWTRAASLDEAIKKHVKVVAKGVEAR
jgi:peroxiredoxin